MTKPGSFALKIAACHLLAAMVAAIAFWQGQTPSGVAPTDPSDALHFDGRHAFAEVKEFVDRFGPRPRSGGTGAEVARYVAERFSAAGLPESRLLAQKLPHHGEPYQNAVARLSGQTQREIILFAHHDTVEEAPGAEDNASGVGVLVELARVLRERKLRHTIVFAVWDAEEIGAYGSEAYVESLSADEFARIDAAVGTEMLGWKDGYPVLHLMQRNFADEAPEFCPAELPHRILCAAREAGLPLGVGDPWLEFGYQIVVRSARVNTGSDDIRFLSKGIPALFLAASSFTRFYPHYHQPTDTVERLSAEQLQRSGRILEASVLALDEMGQRAGGGTRYFLFRGSLVTHGWLVLLSLAVSLPVLWTAWKVSHRRGRQMFLGVVGTASWLAAAWGFWPLAWGALSSCLVAWPWALYGGSRLPGRVARSAGLFMPAYLATLMTAVWHSFGPGGFRLRVGAAEWVAVSVGLAAYIVACWDLRRSSRQSTRRPSETLSE